MIELIALALAIVLLLQLQRLRGVLSLVFSPLRARRLASPQLPAAFADLHAQAAQTLGDLGFDGPYWYLVEGDSGTLLPAHPAAGWRRRDSGDVIWLYPPPSPERPNQLLMIALRRLADGRYAQTQAYDCYGELVANAQLVAQTVAADDVAALWQQHSRWCDGLGAADPSGSDDDAMDAQVAEFHNRSIDTLLAAGKIYRDSSGLLRPRLRYALTILSALRRRPKPPKPVAPVPPERLVWLAQLAQRQLARPVPRRVQAGLFGLSTLLFLLAGGWFWGVRFAVLLFVAVFIHELGHYLAMRAFGYRNVQMLALPLVGGVTIGHEARPDAAQRAWMSLMGPLPGILIGWAIVAFLLFSAAGGGSLINGLLILAAGGGGADSWLWLAAFIFLFLNYLNVLPVPPLDGAHVVQALLPTGSARLTAVFIAVAAVIGAAVALWAGFTLLALLAATQLATAVPRWQLAKVLARLRADPDMAPRRPAALRLQRVFETYDAVAGTATPAAQRIGQALEASRSLDIQPMRWLPRLAISAVYLFLLAGPVVAGGGWLWWRAQLSQATAIGQATARQWKESQARFAEQVKTRDLSSLLADLSQLGTELGLADSAGAAARAPADAAAIAAVQTQLGAPLPEDLLAFYRLHDGIAVLNLRPLHAIAAAPRLTPEQFDDLADAGKIHFYRNDENLPDIALDRAQAQALLLLGHDDELSEFVFYDTAATPLHAGVRVYRTDIETTGVHASLHERLQQTWVSWQQQAEYQRRQAAGH